VISDLKPYPDYRLGEVRWLGEIPSHWTVRRMKYVVREANSRSTTGKEQLLRISQYTGVTQRRRADGIEEPDTRADSLVGYKRVEPNDLVINIMLAWNGSMGVSRFSGIASPAYCVYRFGRGVHPWYLHNLLRSPAYKARIKASSTGVVESRLRLYSDDLGRIEAILPPPAEQAAIVRFLDWANARLERAIRAKRKVIALLNEQKRAIIHRAVTRGLAPSVPLKPSGLPWLGNIPQHWEAKRLKAIAQIRYGLGQPPREDETGIPLIRATNVDKGRILEKNLVRVDPADVPRTRNAFLRAGEIIVVRSGALTADSAMIPKEYEGAVAGYDMVVTVRSARPEFIAMALLSSYVQADQLVIASMRAAQPHLNAEELGTAIFLLPPDEEQNQVVEFVLNESFPIDSAISRLEREIEFLREYRTRLVADVVTGKLDVREAAVHLPEEVAPDTAEDDTDSIDEAERADEEAVV
jgi:type I restriction enzyme S subunit